MYNSGSRASVVHVSCLELDSHTPIPDTRVHISPSAVVVPAHSTGEIHLYYRPSKEEEEKCESRAAVPVAQLLVQSGDECVRQKLIHALREKRPTGGRGNKSSPFITRYLTDLPSQEEVKKGTHYRHLCKSVVTVFILIKIVLTEILNHKISEEIT